MKKWFFIGLMIFVTGCSQTKIVDMESLTESDRKELNEFLESIM